MKITISGKAGSGKSTIAKRVAKKLKLKHYSVGDLMRKLAKNKKISLLKLGMEAERIEKIDRFLDNKQKEIYRGKKFVIDGRLTAYFMPRANLKVFLDCEDKIRAKRILNENRKDEKNKSLRQVINDIKKRELSEWKRYMKYYNVDYYNKDLYDLVIDTTFMTVEEVLNIIEDFIKKK